MLSVSEALRMVLDSALPMRRERVSFRHALGRALAEDIIAGSDLPPFDRSAMDGYALRARDTRVVEPVLEVVGEIPAGRPADVRIDAGQAASIMTGAAIPEGADAVQMVEWMEKLDGGKRVRVGKPVVAGENIRRRGEDLRAGATVLTDGAPVRSSEIALLASLGIAEVAVRRAPRVALISTGDELVEPGETPLSHQIHNSNAYAIEAILRDMGLTAEYLGIASDDREALGRAVRRGLDADVLCLTGGVSMGEYDLVGDVLRAEGIEIVFHKVSIKPGKPLMFARRAGRLVFGLPGNPVSSVCDFALFVAPALRKMLGYSRPGNEEVSGILEAEIRQKPGREWYCLSHAEWKEGAYRVTPVPQTGSADLRAACRANAYAIVPAEASHVPAGASVRVLLWGKGF